jgi:RNA 2',3'-cyclic 3'-phosphodiesterase
MKAMADEISTGRLRLFVAISIPEPFRDEIARVQRELESIAPPRAIRWTRPEQFHVTLRFLGGVPAAHLENLKAAVGAVCANVRPLQLRAAGVGFFPNARRPRVIWVGIQDAEQLLINLQKQIEAAVQPFTAERGAENFTGHVTLARVKNLKRSDAKKLAAHVQTIGTRRFGDWMAREIKIVQSELSLPGASHRLLTAFPLAEKNESL